MRSKIAIISMDHLVSSEALSSTSYSEKELDSLTRNDQFGLALTGLFFFNLYYL
jgi:hypothetical protein